MQLNTAQVAKFSLKKKKTKQNKKQIKAIRPMKMTGTLFN